MSKRNLMNIKLLGGIELSRGAIGVPLPQSKKTRALLAYLVVTPDRTGENGSARYFGMLQTTREVRYAGA